MAFREVAVTEIREVQRAWLSGAGLRQVATLAGMNRQTARRYVQAAAEAGLAQDGGPEQLTDELVGLVAEAGPAGAPGRARAGVGSAGGLPGAGRRAVKGPVGRQDRGCCWNGRGLLADPVSGRQRKVHALIFTACYSRHMFVWLSFTQTLAAFIAGCEAGWVFFGGLNRLFASDQPINWAELLMEAARSGMSEMAT